MHHSQWEIIILKPTSVFLTFLASQIPNVTLPDLRLLQSDCTAYAIKKQENDEETLNEIERHFAFIFKHELNRWLGNAANTKIEGSFLDFLCCFKFELHSNIAIMENSLQAGHQLLRIKPRSVLLKWIKANLEEQMADSEIIDKISLATLMENSTIIVKNFNNLDFKAYLKDYYQLFYKAEMMRICNNESHGPEIDCYQSFCKYFAVDFHSELIHLPK